MHFENPVASTMAIACPGAMWTSNQAKLALKPHEYTALHPSALLPFAFLLLSSFDL